eukprot:14124270-Ditylum_brightwellii.AAC.1
MYIKFVILFIHADLKAVLVGDRLSLSRGVLCIHGVAGQDPLGNCVGLPCSNPMGRASEVVPAGHSNDLPLGVIVEGLSEVDPVEDH